MIHVLLGTLILGHTFFLSASAQELAYLIRRSQNAKTHQEFLCEVFPHRIDLIEYRNGTYLYRKTRNQDFPSQLMNSISKAEVGPWVRFLPPGEHALQIHYYGHYLNDNGINQVDFKIWGRESLLNQSEVAITLINYLDRECESLSMISQ
jgi:hypothetical protein